MSTTMPTTIKRNTIPREEIPSGAILCDYCAAKCCKYFALPIDRPKKKPDYEFIRWYLLHDRASIFVEEGTWYLLVHTQCKHLQDDYLCGIYETRPQVCRDYTVDECEYEELWTYDKYFETPEQIHEYAEAVLSPKDGTDSIRSAKPPLLPIA